MVTLMAHLPLIVATTNSVHVGNTSGSVGVATMAGLAGLIAFGVSFPVSLIAMYKWRSNPATFVEPRLIVSKRLVDYLSGRGL